MTDVLYYITVALTAFFYALAGLVVLFAVATAVGCLVSETGRKLADKKLHLNHKSTKKHNDEDNKL